MSGSQTLWIAVHQTPLSRRFSKQESWSGFPCPLPRDLPDSGIELMSLTSPALAGGFFIASDTWDSPNWYYRALFSWNQLFSSENHKTSSLIINYTSIHRFNNCEHFERKQKYEFLFMHYHV